MHFTNCNYFLFLIYRCITGSYDRTAKVWDLDNGKCLTTLTGHEDVVFDVTFVGKNEYVYQNCKTSFVHNFFTITVYNKVTLPNN